MGRRSTVTYEDVVRAVAELDARGESVTNAAVLAITGGSNTTIGPLMRQWRDGQRHVAPQADGAAPVAELPPAIERVLSTLAPTISTALGQIRAEERRSARAEIDAIRTEAEVVRNGLEATLQAERASFDDLATEADRLADKVEEVEAARKAEAERAAALATDLAAARAEKEQMAGQVETLLRQFADAQAAAARAEAERDVALGRIGPVGAEVVDPALPPRYRAQSHGPRDSVTIQDTTTGRETMIPAGSYAMVRHVLAALSEPQEVPAAPAPRRARRAGGAAPQVDQVVPGKIRGEGTSGGHHYAAPEGELLRDGQPTGARIVRRAKDWALHVNGQEVRIDGGGRQGTLYTAIAAFRAATEN
jgi:hypothetical protein